jgi:hypothetical protein
MSNRGWTVTDPDHMFRIAGWLPVFSLQPVLSRPPTTSVFSVLPSQELAFHFPSRLVSRIPARQKTPPDAMTNVAGVGDSRGKRDADALSYTASPPASFLL